MNRHTCCAWCVPPVHCYTAFVDHSITSAQELLDTYGAFARRYADMELLAARLAPEADVDTMLAERRQRGMPVLDADLPGFAYEQPVRPFGRVWLITYRDLASPVGEAPQEGLHDPGL